MLKMRRRLTIYINKENIICMILLLNKIFWAYKNLLSIQFILNENVMGYNFIEKCRVFLNVLQSQIIL